MQKERSREGAGGRRFPVKMEFLCEPDLFLKRAGPGHQAETILTSNQTCLLSVLPSGHRWVVQSGAGVWRLFRLEVVMVGAGVRLPGLISGVRRPTHGLGYLRQECTFLIDLPPPTP